MYTKVITAEPEKGNHTLGKMVITTRPTLYSDQLSKFIENWPLVANIPITIVAD